MVFMAFSERVDTILVHLVRHPIAARHRHPRIRVEQAPRLATHQVNTESITIPRDHPVFATHLNAVETIEGLLGTKFEVLSITIGQRDIRTFSRGQVPPQRHPSVSFMHRHVVWGARLYCLEALQRDDIPLASEHSVNLQHVVDNRRDSENSRCVAIRSIELHDSRQGLRSYVLVARLGGIGLERRIRDTRRFLRVRNR